MLQPNAQSSASTQGPHPRRAKGGYELNFGTYGLKAQEPDRVTARQIEAARRAMTRHMKRAGRVWIRIFPDLPVSKKPTEVRMGKGKGSVEYWAPACIPAASCLKSTVCREDVAQEAFRLAAAKLPVKTRFVRASANSNPAVAIIEDLRR
jgi:large subunit ribosomal protein L16